MTIEARLNSLQQKHLILKKSVINQSNNPSADFNQINELKKQKLLIKEEIAKISKKV